jgi:hypothetical protein
MSNGQEGKLVRVELPKVGSSDPVRIFYRDALTIPDHWYYVTISGGQQQKKASFRSRGKVLSVEPVESSVERVKVRVLRPTDDPDEPDVGTFALTYELRRDQAAIYHAMTFVPRRPLVVHNYQFFATTEKPSAKTHRFHFIEPGWQVGSRPAETQEQYGRIAFPHRHPWLALEEVSSRRLICLGAPPADVTELQYAIEFKRFELSRAGGRITVEEPLQDFAWFGFGDNVARLMQSQRDFEAQVSRPSRSAEPELPAAQLTKPAPAASFGRRVLETQSSIEVEADDFKLSIDKRTGALAQLETANGRLLNDAGGLVLVVWPKRQHVGPSGQVSNIGCKPDEASYDLKLGDLTTHHALKVQDRHVLWDVSVPNNSNKDLLVEARLTLPLHLGDGPCFFWDGLQLKSVSPKTSGLEMTTLVPGQFLSQGILPAVCLHNEKYGVALGLQPMQIESFYGSRVSPAEGKPNTFCYAVRLAIPPGKTREARFVLYVIDPNWSWRSCVERYWGFWPEVFEAPKRDDVWGLYATSSPTFVHNQGDKFIELCRRMRVGGMELYAPFDKTGDFYPDSEPALQRGKPTLSREEMRRMYETANLACCNLSYVIPTKCEREMAKAKYSDSIIRLANGEFFLSDIWDVMGGHREKLAAMFAWGDSFGENLRAELRQIVQNYRPDGFYLDNGAFVWQDYGRTTEWAAFDDEGKIYTNAGIAYAKLLDDLREFAPEVHRNPGEFIQYFSGFRAHSHLTNCVGTQPHYIRSHRLIMGYKPIFPNHPDRFGSKSDVFDALEVGGLPWLAGFQRKLEPLAQAWAPVAIALARAGWKPIPLAAADTREVRIERFGQGDGAFFTVRNLSDQNAVSRCTVAGSFPRLCDFHGRAKIEPRVDARSGVTEFSLAIPGEEMIVLRATPAPPPSKWPKALFLAEARPASIVLRPDADATERHTARRIKGFIELQAELLKQPAEVEIVERISSARHPNRVIIQPSKGETTVAETSPDTLTISVSEEDTARHALSDFLDTLAKPMTTEPPRWMPY